MLFYEDPVYIEMCKKATELQEEHGEVWITFGKGILFSYNNVYIKYLPKEDNPRWRLAWLPYQHQLQAMFDFYPDNPLPPHKLIKALWDWWSEDLYSRNFFTHEQFLLAFLYKEKYHKGWDGTSWVKHLI